MSSRRVRECLARLADTFSLTTRERHEPHITLCGPFTLAPGNDPVSLIDNHHAFLGKFPSLMAELGDLLMLRGRRGWAVVFQAHLDEHLARLATHIREILAPQFRACSWIDRLPGQRIFHVSIGFGLRHERARKLLESLGDIPPRTAGHHGICRLADTCAESYRLVVIRRGTLWKAYDFPRKTWLTRGEVFRKQEWEKTLAAFRKQEGFQLDEPGFMAGDATFVISDLHLGHANVIIYTSRPFSDVKTMDNVLIRNWNFRVKPTDTVYFLGDLRHGQHAKTASHYLSLLQGSLYRVSGSHDEGIEGSARSMETSCRDQRFLMVHDPEDAPPDYTGFVIHGQLQNNQVREFPFLDMPGRRVNVSAEMVGYVPLCLDELMDIIESAPPGARFPTLADARRALCRKEGQHT
ncbi:MAG: hypothetical protein MUC66_05630 [Methanolinea sp.]|nr:hypothetical protein [Methanolinea sp.]